MDCLPAPAIALLAVLVVPLAQRARTVWAAAVDFADSERATALVGSAVVTDSDQALADSDAAATTAQARLF